MFKHMAEYIDRLDTEAEDRLLTTKLVPGEISAEKGTAGCIIGVASGAFKISDFEVQFQVFGADRRGSIAVVMEFNQACRADPIATAEFIRNRILENRVRKELLGVRETARETADVSN